MESRDRANEYLSLPKGLRKRPSDEAMEGIDLKKRDLGEARTSHVVALSARTNAQELGLRISLGLDPSADQNPGLNGSLEQIVTLGKNRRVFRKAHRAEELEKSTWARCY